MDHLIVDGEIRFLLWVGSSGNGLWNLNHVTTEDLAQDRVVNFIL